METLPPVGERLGNSAYVVDLGHSRALVVDPERDPRLYLRALDHRRLLPRFAAGTYLHANIVSGGRELLARDATLLAPAGSELPSAYRPLADSEEIDFGGLTLRAIATPGHTGEPLAYLLLDGSRPARRRRGVLHARKRLVPRLRSSRRRAPEDGCAIRAPTGKAPLQPTGTYSTRLA